MHIETISKIIALFIVFDVKNIDFMIRPNLGLCNFIAYQALVRAAGLEPALPYGNKILSLACLPISPRPQKLCVWLQSRD